MKSIKCTGGQAIILIYIPNCKTDSSLEISSSIIYQNFPFVLSLPSLTISSHAKMSNTTFPIVFLNDGTFVECDVFPSFPCFEDLAPFFACWDQSSNCWGAVMNTTKRLARPIPNTLVSSLPQNPSPYRNNTICPSSPVLAAESGGFWSLFYAASTALPAAHVLLVRLAWQGFRISENCCFSF
jgi:hypothetical protein